ncbi:hypothetical protein Q8A73_014927 [Channa argus]|nr:hypothetical protein Q8A73_014927 [Channa argus]
MTNASSFPAVFQYRGELRLRTRTNLFHQGSRFSQLFSAEPSSKSSSDPRRTINGTLPLQSNVVERRFLDDCVKGESNMATRRVPLILLLCGSFNPITNQHMRLLSWPGTKCTAQPERGVHESDMLSHHRQNIFHVHEWVRNETSATGARHALRQGVSMKYLIPNSVVEYIHQHNLCTEDSRWRNEGKVLMPLTK